MNTAHPNNSGKLFTLQEAAIRLNVSVETLISWNEHSILKPTITQHGAVGYTEYQLTEFRATIQQVIQQTNLVNHSLPPSVSLGHTAHNPVQQHPFVTIQTPVEHSVRATTDNTASEGKYAYSKRVISLAVIVILLTAVFTQENVPTPSSALEQAQQKFTNVLGLQTSKLNISEQILAALPIQMKSDQSSERTLREKETSVFKEKTTAPALYTSRTEAGRDSTVAAATTQLPEYRSGSTIAINPNSYTSTGLFKNQEDTTAAIDEHGNIRGDAKADTLASIVGSIDEKTNLLQQSSTHATNQLILIFLGMFAIVFAFQKQFAFVQPGRRITISPEPFLTTTPLTTTKILEIDQKTDGTVVLYLNGNEYKISKPEMNSESDQFIERLMTLAEGTSKEIEYDTATAGAIRFATPLSRLVTRLGFVGIKRDLFFPRTSKTSVLFRKYLTKQDLEDMNLTTNQILNEMELLS